MCGWARAAAPTAEITASINGEVVGTATYGLARPDVASLYPDRPEAARSGLILTFDLPSRKSGATEPMLTVRTADGEIGHHALRFEMPPQEVDVGIVDPLDPAGARPKDSGPLPIHLYIAHPSVHHSRLLPLQGCSPC